MLDLHDLKLTDEQGFFYLASPYTKWPNGIDDAWWTIAKLAGECVRAGVCVYSPIVHAHAVAIASGLNPLSHDIWLPMDKPIAHRAFGIIVAGMPGWRDSFGVGEELAWFAAAQKPRYLLDPATLAVQPIA